MREVDSVAGAGAALLPPSLVICSLSSPVHFLSMFAFGLPLNVQSTCSQHSQELLSTHDLGSNAGTRTESSYHLAHSTSRLEIESTTASQGSAFCRARVCTTSGDARRTHRDKPQRERCVPSPRRATQTQRRGPREDWCPALNRPSVVLLRLLGAASLMHFAPILYEPEVKRVHSLHDSARVRQETRYSHVNVLRLHGDKSFAEETLTTVQEHGPARGASLAHPPSR